MCPTHITNQYLYYGWQVLQLKILKNNCTSNIILILHIYEKPGKLKKVIDHHFPDY